MNISIELAEDLLRLFRDSPRIGIDKDLPEGVGYIHISDTLANYFARLIEADLQKSMPHFDEAQPRENIKDVSAIGVNGMHCTIKTVQPDQLSIRLFPQLKQAPAGEPHAEHIGRCVKAMADELERVVVEYAQTNAE